jgi:hypothetical protein
MEVVARTCTWDAILKLGRDGVREVGGNAIEGASTLLPLVD